MASIVLKTAAMSHGTTFQLVGRHIARCQVGLTAVKLSSAKHTMTSLSTDGVPSCPVDSSPKLKPFSEMPGPKGLPVIGTVLEYFKKDGLKFNKMFEVMQMRSHQYGPIYRENIGVVTSIVVSDPDEYVKVMRGEGKCPNRLEMDPMVHYRKKRGMSLGTVNSQGVEWYRHRAVLNKKMLLPKEVLSYLQPMEEVANDFVTRLRHIRGADGGIKNIEMEVFMWAMESIGTVLFEERIGCFKDPPPPEAKEFITNLVGFFRTMQPLLYSLRMYKYFPTKRWRDHERCADKVVEIGQHYVNKKLEELTHKKSTGQQATKSSFLTYLLNQKALTPEEVNGHIIDLLMAAVETVSNTLLWTLYCLAINPDVQEKLYAEVAKERSNDQPLDLGNMHYLKACFKEMFRMYPVTFATSRVIPEDLEIGGYEVPAGSHVQANVFTMGRNPAYFPEPLRYLPDRWLRDGDDHDEELVRRRQVISGLPFGHGSRMCIGRRFAEQELYILMAKLVQNFRIKYVGETPQPVLNTVLTPDRPLQFTITPRSDPLV